MFRWIRILSQLAKNDSIIETMEHRYAQAVEAMNKFDRKYQECLEHLEALRKFDKEVMDDLKSREEKIAEDRAAQEAITAGLEKCQEQLKQKMEELRENAKKYVEEIGKEVAGCRDNVSDVGRKLKVLEETIAEFQR